MARVCGVCEQNPREGHEMRPIRLSKGEVKGKEPGLYDACDDCMTAKRETLAEERGVELHEVPYLDLA